jgi:hypothetical protein
MTPAEFHDVIRAHARLDPDARRRNVAVWSPGVRRQLRLALSLQIQVRSTGRLPPLEEPALIDFMFTLDGVVRAPGPLVLAALPPGRHIPWTPGPAPAAN